MRVEIAHVWPDGNQIFQGSHNACRQLIDGLSNVAGTISSLTARPIGYVSDWATDQVAPEYWVPNSEIKASNFPSLLSYSIFCAGYLNE